jgi:hypothetical protein
MLILAIAILLTIIGYGLLFGPPFVPTHLKDLERLFSEVDVSNKVFVDLGMGDGRVLKVALEFGASEVVGYEINPFVYGFARIKFRNTEHCSFHLGPWQNGDVPDGAVVYVFADGRRKLAHEISDTFSGHKVITYGARLEGRSGTQIGAHTVHMPVAKHKQNRVA